MYCKYKISILNMIMALVSILVLSTLVSVLGPTSYAHAYASGSEEELFLNKINTYRAQNGLPALVESSHLNNASVWFSNDMATKNYFPNDHVSQDGRTFDRRIKDFGYTYNTYLGENIAAGQEYAYDATSEVNSVFDAWKNSPPHNENMLNGNFRAIGIGRVYGAGSQYGWYWTTDFGGLPDPPTLIGSYDLGKVFYIENGKRRALASPGVFANWGFNWGNVVWAPLGTVYSFPQGDDLTLMAVNAGRVYMMQNSTFRHIFDADTFNIFKDNWGLGWGDIKPVSDGVLASYSMGEDIFFPRLVTYSGGGAVYRMDSDGKRQIQNAPTFEHWGFHWGEIFYTNNNAFLAGYPSPHPLSVLASNGGKVYLIENDTRRWIETADIFNAHAATDPVYNWGNIFPVSFDLLNQTTAGDNIT